MPCQIECFCDCFIKFTVQLFKFSFIYLHVQIENLMSEKLDPCGSFLMQIHKE